MGEPKVEKEEDCYRRSVRHGRNSWLEENRFQQNGVRLDPEKREGGERGFGKECWTDDRTEIHAIRFSTAFLAVL